MQLVLLILVGCRTEPEFLGFEDTSNGPECTEYPTGDVCYSQSREELCVGAACESIRQFAKIAPIEELHWWEGTTPLEAGGFDVALYECHTNNGSHYDIYSTGPGLSSEDWVFAHDGKVQGISRWEDARQFYCDDGCPYHMIVWGVPLPTCVRTKAYTKWDFGL